MAGFHDTSLSVPESVAPVLEMYALILPPFAPFQPRLETVPPTHTRRPARPRLPVAGIPVAEQSCSAICNRVTATPWPIGICAMETLPDASVAVEKPQPRLMHERRGLKRLPGRLSGHVRRRQPPQFIINQRQQFVGGTAPGIQRLQNAGDVFFGFAVKHFDGCGNGFCEFQLNLSRSLDESI